MYKNKSTSGLNNLCGEKIRSCRKSSLHISQRQLADLLQMQGLDLDKNAIQRIECGKRFVTDIELKTIADVLGISCEELLS